MKLLIDLLPVVLFFLSFKWGKSHPDEAYELLNKLPFMQHIDATQAPILLATIAVMVSSALLIVWSRWRHGKVDKMLWVSFAMVVVLGGMTLAFHNPLFLMWKPTALYWLFAILLAGSTFFYEKNLIKTLLTGKLNLPEIAWTRINQMWIVFFVILGGINLWVAYTFSQEVWVNFKLFGLMILMVAFLLLQGVYLSRYIKEDDSQEKSSN